MNKLLIVGTVAFDSIETPFGKVDRILGGSGMFIGISSSVFNINNAIVSVVGSDFPEEYLTLLKTKKIDISGIEIVKGGKTFFWKGLYHVNMNHRDTLNTELNVLADFKPKVPNNYKNADIVLLGNLHPSTQLSVLEQMNSKPKLVILDTMNYWMDNSLDELINVISKVDLLCINDQEAEQLTGESDLKIAAQKISDIGPKFLIIKKGEFGSLVFGEDDYYNCPIFPTEKVKDPTGAGDTFAGGLAGYLASCSKISFDEVKNGVMYGTAIASYCIEDFGPNNIMNLDINLIEKRVSKIKK
ncbi:PfkB family carbohydrate kinase [Flavobacteriaceae bacterium]|nr:bifunctional hydroxymethylpyrimidine kinase/phosphomethylpyrimidine kinase [Flavobacteriales bacterium]MBL6877958.1 bifunctional hydroxymethylpyrimidine kinase/phosphomethylpyrimidine kinase [Flavobacteriaceae bacterium]MDA9551215.1 PfkB family carbohydrate kinase [Flavobacteriaceae bacterium]MDA9850203.1 PfkB family carbohydrate kinase [Flavobacteriaceae bacterium]